MPRIAPKCPNCKYPLRYFNRYIEELAYIKPLQPPPHHIRIISRKIQKEEYYCPKCGELVAVGPDELKDIVMAYEY